MQMTSVQKNRLSGVFDRVKGKGVGILRSPVFLVLSHDACEILL